MTDKEFMTMMVEKYHIEDFSDVARMCLYLSRFARMSVEISKEYDNKYGKDNETAFMEMSKQLDNFSFQFLKAYADEL